MNKSEKTETHILAETMERFIFKTFKFFLEELG